MNTITVILIICLILVLFVLLNNSAKKVENYKKKYPDVIPDITQKSKPKNERYRIFEHTREIDDSKYYTLMLARIGYPGQWDYADPDGNEYSANCIAARLQTYQTIEEAEIDAEIRIKRNIVKHQEYEASRYNAKLVKEN